MGTEAKSAPKSSVSITKDHAYLQTIIPKRIELFESIKAEQLAHLKSIAGDPIKVTLPDGTVKEGKKWETTPLDIAKEVSKSLASNALISQVNGVLWDMSRPLEDDCQLKIFTFDSDEGRDTFWHSSAHILGQALEMTYGCKLCIGPCTTRGEGFYYDGFYGDLGLTDDHFDQIVSGANADGAFYGPKIDISVSDAMKRKFQLATLQLDFQLPQRFNFSYSAEDECKRERPVMIHRAVLGSVERMFAILLEHYKGKWPLWLSPRQAIVCPVSDKSQAYGLQVRDEINKAGYYVDIDTSDRTIQKKVREAQLAQYNYILVVGEEEANTGKVSVRVRDKKEHSVKSILDLLTHLKEEVEAFH